jgi:hypothetical protein
VPRTAFSARRLGFVAALTLGLAVAGPLASVATAAVTGQTKPDAIATLKVMNPSVSVKKKGTKPFKPATDGQELHAGDVVKTDTTGLAEVDYSDDSYTRLDVSTTLKIVKLSDDQGNRQVDTSVDVGRTWNRTAELTESQSFEQSGAGATAAVVGTAFAVECDPIVAPATESHHCTTIAVIHTTEWTGADGTQIDLGPYETCDATDGVICDRATQIAQFDEWILRNLYLDFLLRGLEGPINGVVSFANGQVTFTPTTTVSTTPPSTPVDVLDPNPIGCDVSCDHPVFPDLANLPPGYAPGTSISVDQFGEIFFVANLTVDPANYFIVFDSLPDGAVGEIDADCECPTVETGQQWDADQVFIFFANVVGTSSFSFHIEDAAGNHVGDSGDVQVNVTSCGSCGDQTAGSTPPASAAPRPPRAPEDNDHTTPSTEAPTDPPPTAPDTTDPPSG